MVNGSPISDFELKLHFPSSSPISSSEKSDRPRRRRRKPRMVNSVVRTALRSPISSFENFTSRVDLRSPPPKTSPPISISDPLLREVRRGCSVGFLRRFGSLSFRGHFVFFQFLVLILRRKKKGNRAGDVHVHLSQCCEVLHAAVVRLRH